MSRQFARDFLIEVAKGNIVGHSLVHKYGRNPAVANGAWEGIWLGSAAFNFLTAATTVRIKAGGNAADGVAGAGAQTVTIEGLDNNGAYATSTITTAGASASAATATSYWRVTRMYVATCGTYGGNNTAQITLENSAGGTDLIHIGVGEGQSQYCAYAIPLGKTGYLLSTSATVNTQLSADMRLFTRENLNDTTTPFAPKRLRHFWDGLVAPVAEAPQSPEFAMPALTDIWFEAYGNGAATKVSAEFEILLVDD